VSKELLDETDICSVLQHERGTTVPEEMAGASFFQAGMSHVVADKLREPFGGEGRSLSGEQDPVRLSFLEQGWSSL
jgi:hypothetical protein